MIRKNHIKLGDVILIPVDDHKCAVGKIIYLSKRDKNVILFNIYPIVANLLETIEPPAEEFTSRLLIYTALNPILIGRWKKIGSNSVNEEERKMSKRITGGEVWIEDNCIGSATERDFTTLPIMRIGGYLIVEKRAKTYLESLQLDP